MTERKSYTPDNQSTGKSRRLNIARNTAGAAAIIFGLGGVGVSAYHIEPAFSGITAREYVQQHQDATPEQIGSHSVKTVANRALEGAACLFAFGVGLRELSHRARRGYKSKI